jgi:hypothetical protein
MAVDVISDAETALATYRISSDIGIVAGGFASGAAISLLGIRGALLAGVGHLLLIAVLVLVVRETRQRAVPRPLSPTLPGGPVMPDAQPPPEPTPELFRALLVDQGLEFLSAERRQAALDSHRAMRPALARLRAAPLSFVEPVSEPASALAWLERGGGAR